MADPVLPPIGRRGIVNSVRKLSGHIISGWRDVDADASFVSGYIATLDGTSGKLVVASDSSTYVVGLFFCHKTTNFYRPVIDESITFTGAATTINLANAYVLQASVKVTDTDGNAYTLTTDFTVNETNGQIIHTSTGSIGTTETVLVDYRYKDPNLTGIDQTLGSGKAAIIESNGEIATLIYETDAAWAINAAVKVSANGLPTVGGGGTTIGFVTKVPASSDPELHFQMRFAV